MTRERRRQGPALLKPQHANNVPGVRLQRTLRGHAGWIGRIAFSPDGRLLASPSGDHSVRLWDAQTGDCLHTIKQQQGAFIAVAFDPSGSMLATASSTGEVKVREVNSGRLLYAIDSHPSPANSVAFGLHGRTLACGYEDGVVKIWEIPSRKLLRTSSWHMSAIHSVAFNPHYDMLATASADRTIKLSSVGAHEQHGIFMTDKATVTGAVFSPQGGTLATASSDRTVKLWDTQNGRLLRTFEGHTAEVKSVGFTHDGQLIASKSSDQTIRLWHCNTGTCVAIIPEPCSSAWTPGLTFHPQLPILATVGGNPAASSETGPDNLIHIWEIDLNILLSNTAEPIVTYTSTKIVLIGESNVGKSYLAHRIAKGRPPARGAVKSTHGMKVWTLDPKRLSPAATAPAGQRRDVMLWDMGGQDEYRLIHQLFLHDTTVALVLLDPTRGAVAFKDVETWNKYLEKQLHGRQAVKLLVGAKVDEPSNTIDSRALKQLQEEHGFAGYYETSAITGRGIMSLCEAVSRAIDWDVLGKTSRPELFQRIRDVISTRRQNGDAVLHVTDLHRALSKRQPTEAEKQAVLAVTEQLAAQGVIARSRVSTGEPVLVLQVEEIERYGGSLIVAARNNPRGVPALELRAIVQPEFELPGIAKKDRLLRTQELPVLECTVQLLLEHGICFEHEGLLVFPSLFPPATQPSDRGLPHAVLLHYDFSGAIDNIYASLVAWLVLARDFGRVRLWADRVELESGESGLCGLRKVARSGGFAHLDVYFEAVTPRSKQDLFISFVEDHLRRHGVEILERVAVTCHGCGDKIDEETIRKRIARGDKDVVCPICEARHDLVEGASVSRKRNPELLRKTWALKTHVERARETVTDQVAQAMTKAENARHASDPIRVLHLSDLHLRADTSINTRIQWLADDLRHSDDWGSVGIERLDYLVISGDFTDRGNGEGHEKAYEFVSRLCKEFDLSAERCILVPGNHDVRDLQEAYVWRADASELKEGEYVRQGDIFLVPSPINYPRRLESFSDSLYHKFVQLPYPTDYTMQGMAIPAWESGIQFLTFNSCWQIDQFHRKRSSVHPDAVANALRTAQDQEKEARRTGKLADGVRPLRIAVWHHAVTGPEQMRDTTFLENLQKNGIKLALHGDVHEMRRDQFRHWHAKRLHVIGAGSFGAPAHDRPESTPRLYNLIEIQRNLKSIRVHTRCQSKPDGAWRGWHEWPRSDGSDGAVSYYDINL